MKGWSASFANCTVIQELTEKYFPSRLILHCTSHRTDEPWHLSDVVRYPMYAWCSTYTWCHDENRGLAEACFCFGQSWRGPGKRWHVLIFRFQCKLDSTWINEATCWNRYLFTLLGESSIAIYDETCYDNCQRCYSIPVLGEIIACFFTFNHSNYARWLPMHMMNLKEQHPGLYAEFQRGNFMVRRSDSHYSLMAKDQSHEHLNNEIKYSGGYSNLNSDDPTTLLIQFLATPQRAELIKKVWGWNTYAYWLGGTHTLPAPWRGTCIPSAFSCISSALSCIPSALSCTREDAAGSASSFQSIQRPQFTLINTSQQGWDRCGSSKLHARLVPYWASALQRVCQVAI